jgi:hypothetical protein
LKPLRERNFVTMSIYFSAPLSRVNPAGSKLANAWSGSFLVEIFVV